MRVLVTGMGWQDEQPGGLNRYALEMSDAVREKGVSVEAIVVGTPEPGRGFVGAAPLGTSLARRVLLVAAKGRVRARTADVIDTHFALYALPVLLAAPRRPQVTHFQGPWYREAAVEGTRTGPATALRKRVEAFVYHRADEIITLSSDFRRLVIDDFGVLPSRVHVIPPGVDLDRFVPRDRSSARAELGLRHEGLMVVATRRLARRMGLDVLIRAWAQAHVENAALFLVGAGTQRNALEELTSRLGVSSSVRFIGRVGEEELPLWYAAADLTVVPSVALEGFGLVVLESLASGTPVIASRTGGMAEMLEEFSPALLVAPGDVGALADKLKEAANDTGRLPTAETCRRFAETFKWSGIADRIIQVYERARLEPRKRPYRVVYLDHCARLSGGELALFRLLKADSHIEPYVILGEDGPLQERLLSAGIGCEVIPFSSRAANLERKRVLRASSLLHGAPTTALYVARLARRLRQLHPDMVHTNSLKSGIYGSVAGRAAGIPVVWHLRDLLDDDAFGRPLSFVLRSLVRRLPAAVIANSSATAASLAAGGAPVHVIPSPVDAIPRQRSEPLDAAVVGIIGRLAPWKGQHVFLDAMAKLTVGHPRLRGRVVGSAMFGEEQYAAELQERARELGISDRVDFVGFREDIAGELSSLSVAVHASILPEPFGQVVVEAMACGVPVVAAAAGGPAEVITDGVDGLLVSPGDPDALATAIDRLLRDAGLREELARAGSITARRYRPEQVAAEVQKVYWAVLAGRRPGKQNGLRTGWLRLADQ